MTADIQRFASPLPLPFSKVVKAGNFLFLSGQIAMDAAGKPLGGDIKAQTRAILESIQATLQEHGASLADAVRSSVWLADLADFPAFNTVYAEFFAGGYPARSTVGAGLSMGALVEIEVQAYQGTSAE
jgi:reactive intermediate/imine deaminase